MTTKIIETFPNGATIERHSVYGYLVRHNGRVMTFSKSIKRAREAAQDVAVCAQQLNDWLGTQEAP